MTRTPVVATGKAVVVSASSQPPAADPAADRFAYICSYTAGTSSDGNGNGITQARLHPQQGLVPVAVTAGPSPSWICFSASGRHAYAVNEIGEYSGKPQGSVTSYAVDPSTGVLALLNTAGAGGAGPAHCEVHPSGRHLLVANYGDGRIAVLPIQQDGSLGDPTDVVTPVGTLGPATAAGAPPGSFAQSGHDGSHAHMIASDPSGRHVLSTDLGFDAIFIWTLDPERGTLRPAQTPSFPAASAGGGPRHFVFHPNGDMLYVVHEEASQIGIYQFDPATAAVALLQVVSTLPDGFAGSSFASSIVISRDGRYVYSGNRLHNSIAVLAVDASGMLQLIATEWTRGDYPNQVVLSPSGAFLFACNRRSDQVTTFHVDPSSGMLSFTGQYLAVGSPNMIGFV